MLCVEYATGPEITKSVVDVVEALSAPIKWER